jgi:glutamate synthase domain-containing protein 3
MAGGLVLVLGIGKEKAMTDRGIGSGIHGGEIIIRGEVDDILLGVGAKKFEFTESDLERIAPIIKSFCEHFGLDPAEYLNTNYTRIAPASSRPFANKYVWE